MASHRHSTYGYADSLQRPLAATAYLMADSTLPPLQVSVVDAQSSSCCSDLCAARGGVVGTRVGPQWWGWLLLRHAAQQPGMVRGVGWGGSH